MDESGSSAKSRGAFDVRPRGGGRPVPIGADSGIKAIGVAAAVCSACFAAYMINTDHSHPSFPGSEHLMIFAQPLRTRGSDAPFVAALPPPQAPAQREAAADIDYTPVGSIGDADNVASRRGVLVKQPAGGLPIQGFTVRSVRNGIASIDGPDGPVDAAPGAVIKRAGRVVAIEMRAGRWTVVTSDGTIVERATGAKR